MRRFWVIGFVLCALVSSAQENLVPNGSFEEHSDCPFSPGFGIIDDWNALHGSPDYYHICGESDQSIPANQGGYQEPYYTTDSAYVAVATYTTFFDGGQESFYVELTEPLIAGEKYRVKLMVSLSEFWNYATCCMGVIFGNTPPPFPPLTSNLSDVELVMDANSIDTDQWYEMDEVYTAQGGESEMYIGNFRPDADSQPIYVGENTPEGDVAYFFIDNISVTLDTTNVGIGSFGSVLGSMVKLYPNPATNLLQVSATIPNGQKARIELMNYMGHRILTQRLNNGVTALDVSALAAGVYHYSVVVDGVVLDTGKQVIVR